MSEESAFGNWKEEMLSLPTFGQVVSGTTYQTIECRYCNKEFESAFGNKRSILCDECRGKIEKAKSTEELLEMLPERMQENIYSEIRKSDDFREFVFLSKTPISTKPVECVPEPEVIQVEGSDEVRRQKNGVWQHKHGSHDYWHPMVRDHKEGRIEELRIEAKRLVEIHNNRAGKILAMAKNGTPKDVIREEIYRLQADQDDVNRFVKENSKLFNKDGIAEILIDVKDPRQQVLGVIRDLQIGR